MFGWFLYTTYHNYLCFGNIHKDGTFETSKI